VKKPIIVTGDIKGVMSIAFMDKEELTKAKAGRNRYPACYSDVRQLTEESRKEMRRRKRRLNKIDKIT